MSENLTPVEPVETDLDVFAAELFGQSKAPSEPASSEETETAEEESDASIEDTHVDEDHDTLAPDNDDETDEDAETLKEDTPKPKKNRFQERIDELNGKYRETERRLNEALAKLEEAQKTKTEPVQTQKSEDGPKPTDLNEDGSEKYPLGEFDPAYIKDVVKHTLDEETKARETHEKMSAEEKARQEAANTLQEQWNEKLVPAQERYPDFQEKGEGMISAFEGIDPAYGDYLTTTIMDMEYGPDVFYYLANNLDEAKAIVDSGAKKATIALGRLEAKFAIAEAEKTIARPKVSKAPEPPQHLNKGSAVTPPSIRGDEKDVDLDTFSKALFAKKR